MERHIHTWGGWKLRLTAGLVAALLGRTGGRAAVRPGSHNFAPSHRTGYTASPTPGPTGVATSPGLVVPAGWKQALPGLILSDFSHYDTLVTSTAQPGRIAACAMPPHPWPKMAPPIFVISDDGGRTWQQRAIPVVGVVWTCDLSGDTFDPNTYAISVSLYRPGHSDRIWRDGLDA